MSNKKVVYVLVSSDDDYYVEMAILSIFSLRKCSPNLFVELVLDKNTHLGLNGHRSSILNMVDYLNVQDVHHHNSMSLSRILKTKLRSIVQGDYLYLDIDAVPVRDISDLFSLDCDIAAAYDGNVDPHNFVFHEFESRTFDEMGWGSPPLPYYNCGVMLAKDNARVDEFYKKWSSLWLECSERGLYKDQPPFHRALQEVPIDIMEIKPQYNALIAMYSGGVRGAKVFHYSTIRFDERSDTWFHVLVKKIKDTGLVDETMLSSVCNSGYPWCDKKSIRLNYAVSGFWGAVRAGLTRLLS